MKFFLAFVVVAVVSAESAHKPIDALPAHILDVISAINSPSTDPATAALLQEQLDSILGQFIPPISVGPAIVDEDQYEPISVGPAIVDEPITVDPVIIGDSSSPLVQIIINVRPGAVGGNPVVVEGLPEVAPTPVIVEEQPIGEVQPSPVIIGELPNPEPVLVAPINPAPVMNLPGILN